MYMRVCMCVDMYVCVYVCVYVCRCVCVGLGGGGGVIWRLCERGMEAGSSLCVQGIGVGELSVRANKKMQGGSRI